MNNMFNPEMMNQMKNMMNPQMMKTAADNFSKMSDDQIRAYLTASGMGHISPQMFRQMTGNLKNMDDNDLEKIKNSDRLNNFTSPGQQATPNKTQNQPIINSKTTSNTPNPTNLNSNNSNNSNYEPAKRKTIIEKLEEIKNKGNDNFRNSLYKEACEKYYEVLNELEYIPDSDRINFKKQIEDLETVCRLNIANSKFKMEDYDIVINECLKVLKKTENFKAHFRVAVSYFKKGNHEKAKLHFLKARQVNPNDEKQQIENYLQEIEKIIPSNKKDNSNTTQDHNLNKEPQISNKIPTPEVDIKNTTPVNFEENKSASKETNPKTNSKLDKLRDIVNNDLSVEEKSSRTQSHSNKEDILIEEEPVNTRQGSVNSGLLKNAEKELSGMDDNQLNSMVNMVRSMDNSTIKSMMSMQGMNLTDDQVEMMKNSMTPEMMRMMKGNAGNFSNPPSSTNLNNNITTASSSPNTNITPPSTQQPSFGGFPDLKNMDMSSMMKMVQDNPQIMNMMGPQMSKMFGGDGMNNDMMMKSMQNILWLISLPSKIKAFFTSTRGIMLIMLIIVLIVAYYKN